MYLNCLKLILERRKLSLSVNFKNLEIEEIMFFIEEEIVIEDEEIVIEDEEIIIEGDEEIIIEDEEIVIEGEEEIIIEDEEFVIEAEEFVIEGDEEIIIEDEIIIEGEGEAEGEETPETPQEPKELKKEELKKKEFQIYRNTQLDCYMIQGTNVVFSLDSCTVTGFVHEGVIMHAAFSEVREVCKKYDLVYFGDLLEKSFGIA